MTLKSRCGKALLAGVLAFGGISPAAAYAGEADSKTPAPPELLAYSATATLEEKYPYLNMLYPPTNYDWQKIMADEEKTLRWEAIERTKLCSKEENPREELSHCLEMREHFPPSFPQLPKSPRFQEYVSSLPLGERTKSNDLFEKYESEWSLSQIKKEFIHLSLKSALEKWNSIRPNGKEYWQIVREQVPIRDWDRYYQLRLRALESIEALSQQIGSNQNLGTLGSSKTKREVQAERAVVLQERELLLARYAPERR